MKKDLLLIFLILFTACQDEKAPVKVEKPQIPETKELEVKARAKVNLLPLAEKEIVLWPAFLKTKTAIEQLKIYNLKELAVNAENIATALLELKSTLPSNFAVPPVITRINVLHTKALVLKQKTKATNIDVAAIESVASNLVSEFEYLKIQLNELFMKAPEDFEIDLEEIEKKEDSLLWRQKTKNGPVMLELPQDLPALDTP